MTGGYKGVMEAVSRGAQDSGAHVAGITMARFEDRVNRYVVDEIRTANFYERFRWWLIAPMPTWLWAAVSARWPKSPSPGRNFSSGWCRSGRWY